jgi:hypothetical protein
MILHTDSDLRRCDVARTILRAMIISLQRINKTVKCAPESQGRWVGTVRLKAWISLSVTRAVCFDRYESPRAAADDLDFGDKPVTVVDWVRVAMSEDRVFSVRRGGRHVYGTINDLD